MTLALNGLHGVRRRAPIGWWLMAGMKVDENGCWNWYATDAGGYGRITWRGRHTMAHRACYEYFVGPVPKNRDLDHLCRNRSCINPWHLEPVTRKENVHRGNGTAGLNARKTHCSKGHPLSGENLAIASNGRRICRICRRVNDTARMRAWRAARAEVAS